MTDMDMPLPEPKACQWLQHGKVVNAFTHAPGDRAKWDYDGYWAKKGYDKAPLFTADQIHARDAQWRAIVAAEVAKERQKVAHIIDGWMTATYSWQGDDPCGAEKARADHAEECIRRIGAAIRAPDQS